MSVCLGKAEQLIGQLQYVKNGAREYSSFAYEKLWLAGPDRFDLSPDLPLAARNTPRRGEVH